MGLSLHKGDNMDGKAFLLLFTGFLALSVPLFATTDGNRALQVRAVVKVHPESQVVKSRPGSSDLPKNAERTSETPAFLRPEVLYIPKPEVSDE